MALYHKIRIFYMGSMRLPKDNSTGRDIMTKVSNGFSLTLVFNYGTDGEGNPILKRKTLRIIDGATDDDIYNAALNLSNLSSKPLERLEKRENYLYQE